MMRILLIEPMGHCIGHFSYYARRLAESLLDTGQVAQVTVASYAGWKDTWPPRPGLSLVQARPQALNVDWAPVERPRDWDRATEATLRCALPLGWEHDIVHLVDCAKPALRRQLPRYPELAAKLVVLEHHVPVAYYLRAVPPFPRGIRTRWRHRRAVKLDQWLATHAVLHVHAEAVAEAIRTVTPAARVTVIPPGSDPYRGELPSRAAAREALGLALGDQPALLLFGFMGPHKGLSLVLQALPGLAPRPHLLIAGPPAADYPVADLVTAAGLAADCTLRLGYVPDEQVPLWFRAADALLLVYPASFVQNSGVLTRAADYRTPAVVADVGQMAQLTRQYGLGLLFTPEDPASLHTALARFLELTEAEREDLRQGLDRFAEDHSWPRIAARHLRLYQDVLGTRP